MLIRDKRLVLQKLALIGENFESREFNDSKSFYLRVLKFDFFFLNNPFTDIPHRLHIS